MYFVYFMRDFYRAGAAQRAPSKQTAAAPQSQSVVAGISFFPPYNVSEYSSAARNIETPELDDYLEMPVAMPEINLDQVQADVLHLVHRLETMQAALNVSDRGRSAFLSSMSHELRTPLNAIMGFADMMKSGVFGEIENPTYKQYVEHIHESGALLLSKINDLLNIASMDVGELTLEESDCALNELLSELVEIPSHNAFNRQQTIKLDFSPEVRLHVDRTKLLCALSHLVANALRHSKDGATIIVMARIQPDEGIILSVRDDGEGIPTAQLATIRDALQSQVAYHHIECGGIGLGLSLSKELVARHEGRLMIDSVRHRGTVVSLILPKERILCGMPRRRGERARADFELV